MHSSRAVLPALGVLAAGTLLVGALPAAAEGLTLRYEPSLSLGGRRSADEAGTVSESESTEWDHLVNARLDRTLAPWLRLDATGTFDRNLRTEYAPGLVSEYDRRRWNGNVQLAAGTRELKVTPFFSRSDVELGALRGAARTEAPRAIQDLYGAFGSWQPEGLPAVTMRLSRAEQRAEGLFDTTTDSAALDVRYALRRLDLRYALQYLNPVNHLAGLDATSVTNSGVVGYSDRVLADRVALTGTYTLTDARVETRASGSGGSVEARQTAVAGLSALEVVPATPVSMTLAATPALVDGDRTTGAGVNLGSSRSAAGDVAPRHLGAQLPNALTPVSTVRVWVDRVLTADVAAAYAWTAYRSDDNLTWTPVALAGPVAFGPFESRFEIRIERTSARYLKVAARPLPAGTTLDPRFADVLVTEVELLEVSAATAARGHARRTVGVGNAAVRAKLLAGRRLFYDLALNMTHTSTEASPGTADSYETYDLLNGLSYDQALGRHLTGALRLERTDSRQRDRADAVTRAAASLGASPLPTLTSTATAAATWTQSQREPDRLQRTVAGYLQAEPYQGIGLNGSATYGVTTQGEATTRTHAEAVTATVTPHPTLTLTGTYGRDASELDAAGITRSATERLEGGFTFAPVPALYLSATLGRVEQRTKPARRVSSVAANLRPFPRGNLFVSFNYSETYDSSFDSRARTFGPYLRWNIHGPTYVEAAYTVQDSTSRLLDTRLTLFTTKLSITL